NGCAVNGAAKHLDVFDKTMSVVEKKDGKYLVFKTTEFGAEVCLDRRRRIKQAPASELLVDHITCRGEDMLDRCRAIATARVADHQRDIESADRRARLRS